MIPEFPNFEKLSYKHKEELKSAFLSFSYGISEHSLGFVYGYDTSFGFSLTRINGNICIYGTIQNIPSFLPPVGNKKLAETIEICLTYLKKKYGGGRINAATKEITGLFSGLPKIKISDDRDNYDYVYEINSLAKLQGAKYQSKRNFISQFKNKYKYEYKQIINDMLPECIKLQEKWCKVKNCPGDELKYQESRCVTELLKNFSYLELFGATLFVDGSIQAFTAAEAATDSTAILHVELANTEYRGIYQAINNLFCKNGLKNFKYVNREQDVGDEGLRKAKLSYHPVKLLEKYNIELNDR